MRPLAYSHVPCGLRISRMSKRIEVVWDLALYPSKGQWFGDMKTLVCPFPPLIHCIIKASRLAVFISSVEWDITGILRELDAISILTTHIFRESTMTSKIPLLLMHIICFLMGNLKVNFIFFPGLSLALSSFHKIRNKSLITLNIHRVDLLLLHGSTGVVIASLHLNCGLEKIARDKKKCRAQLMTA